MTAELIAKLDKMCPVAKEALLGTIISSGMTISGNSINADGTPTEGTWRQMVNSDGNLETQRYESGAWVMKQTIEA